jgi:F-type H+-transporting ATPase subunit b
VRTRTRMVVACAGLALLGTLALSAPASAAQPVVTSGATPTAAPETNYASKADEECAKKLAEGGSIDDCQKAPSPLKPETNEIIWGSLAFLVLLVAMWKWGVPAVKNMQKAREDRIRGDLEAAEKARTDAEAAGAEYRAQIGNARNEAAQIIDEARQSADAVRRELTARAEAEAAEIRARASDELRLQIERATADLRQQVGAMSVDLASKIVERNLDAATQQQLIDNYISSVGSN